MRCWKCGFVMSEDAEICSRCGSNLEKIDVDFQEEFVQIIKTKSKTEEKKRNSL